MSRDMIKPTKTQISLGIRPIWSESSLCAQWVAKDPSFLHADSEDWSDWAYAPADLSFRWTHSQLVGFIMSWLICLIFLATSPEQECLKYKILALFSQMKVLTNCLCFRDLTWDHWNIVYRGYCIRTIKKTVKKISRNATNKDRSLPSSYHGAF